MKPEQHFYFCDVAGPDANVTITVPMSKRPEHQLVRSVIEQLSFLSPIATQESEDHLEITTSAVILDTLLNILSASNFYQRKLAFSIIHLN